MLNRNVFSSEEMAAGWPELPSSPESIIPGANQVLEINRAVRGLIFDYTLGAAILGLIPVYNDWGYSFSHLALFFLLLKMRDDIGSYWGYPKGQDTFAIAGNFFGILGGVAITLMARGLFSLIGLFIPYIIVLNRGVDFATLTWALGRSSNQYELIAKQFNQANINHLLKIQQTRLRQRTPIWPFKR